MFSCTWAGKSENLTIQWKSYIDILIRSTNVDRKTMQPKRMTCGLSMRIGKWNQFGQFRWTSTKAITTEKT